MKTTFDIAGNILERSRRLAKREKVPLKELVEEGLRLVLEKHQSRPAHRVKPVTFKGRGLTAAFAGRGWDDIRDASYGGRGA